MGSGHRDITNLKKALSDMQMLNNKNLQTIYEKGDQNLEQMQQLEDLSAIIRKKDHEIADHKQMITDLEMQNRALHKQIQEQKEAEASKNADKGMDLLMNGSMKDKMMSDPRFLAMQKK